MGGQLEPIALTSHSLTVPRTWPVISLFYPMSSSKIVGFSAFCSSSFHSARESRVTKQQGVTASSRWITSPSAISLQLPRRRNRVLAMDYCPSYQLFQKPLPLVFPAVPQLHLVKTGSSLGTSLLTTPMLITDPAFPLRSTFFKWSLYYLFVSPKPYHAARSTVCTFLEASGLAKDNILSTDSSDSILTLTPTFILQILLWSFSCVFILTRLSIEYECWPCSYKTTLIYLLSRSYTLPVCHGYVQDYCLSFIEFV